MKFVDPKENQIPKPSNFIFHIHLINAHIQLK